MVAAAIAAGVTVVAVWALPEELLLQKGVLFLSWQNERRLAGIAATGVAWRWRLTFATIA